MKISKLSATVGVFVVCVSFASVRAQDTPAQAAAREALMKQMNQVQAPEPQTPPTTPTPVAPTAPVAPAAPAAVVVVPNPSAEAVQPTNAAPAVLNADAQTAVRAALLEKMNATSPQTPMPAKGSGPAAMSAPAPIVAPALPISMTKAQRLQALLVQYKADLITPEQYQKQRAAILAEP